MRRLSKREQEEIIADNQQANAVMSHLTGIDEEENRADLLECLREAESLIGTETTEMFMDEVAPEHRLDWLRKVRELLARNKVEPENLSGRWHA